MEEEKPCTYSSSVSRPIGSMKQLVPGLVREPHDLRLDGGQYSHTRAGGSFRNRLAGTRALSGARPGRSRARLVRRVEDIVACFALGVSDLVSHQRQPTYQHITSRRTESAGLASARSAFVHHDSEREYRTSDRCSCICYDGCALCSMKCRAPDRSGLLVDSCERGDNRHTLCQRRLHSMRSKSTVGVDGHRMSA